MRGGALGGALILALLGCSDDQQRDEEKSLAVGMADANDEERDAPTTPAAPPGIIVDDTFVLFPITTEFQRKSLRLDVASRRPASFVAIYGNALIDGNKETGEFELTRLQAALKRRPGKQEVGRIDIYYHAPYPKPGQHKELYQAISALVKPHFEITMVSKTSSGALDVWKDLVARAQASARNNDTAEEAAHGDELVVAYPIETTLSRILSGDSSCYVEINRPLSEERGFFETDLLESLHRALEKLPRRGDRATLSLKGLVVSEGPGSRKRFLDKALEVLRPHGFRHVGYSIDVASVQYLESFALVGKSAPDFTLPRLGYEETRSFLDITRNKVALISFWGFG